MRASPWPYTLLAVAEWGERCGCHPDPIHSWQWQNEGRGAGVTLTLYTPGSGRVGGEVRASP